MKVTGIEVDGKMYDPVEAAEYNPENKGFCGDCDFAEKDIRECGHLCRPAEHGIDEPMILKERKRGVSGVNIDAIVRHYEHAKKKHPHFCDGLLPTEVPDPYFPKERAMERDEMMAEIGSKLSSSRNRIEAGNKNHNLLWNEILDCEVWEITEAMANENIEHAVEECYDAIAVLLRTIDVIMGRQKLGNPKEEGGAK